MARGKINITKIGSQQLLNLLAIVDSKHENEKINKLRSMLSVTAPTYVDIDLNSGLMDLKTHFKNRWN